MNDERDEFQELIRSFSLNNATEEPPEKRRSPSPPNFSRTAASGGAYPSRPVSSQPSSTQSPARPPSSQQPYTSAGEEFLRRYSPQDPSRAARPYPPAGAVKNGGISSPRPSSPPPRQASSVSRGQDMGMNLQFRNSAQLSSQRQTASGATARPGYPGTAPQQPGSVSRQSQPPTGNSVSNRSPANAPGVRHGFNPAGFEAQAAASQTPVAAPSNVPNTNTNTAGYSAKRPQGFQLNIHDEEYRNIANRSAPAGSQGGRDASHPTGMNSGRSSSPPPSKGGGGKPPKPPKEPRRRKKKKDHRGLRMMEALVIALSLVGFSIFLSIFALQSASDLLGMNKPDLSAEVTIPDDASVGEIADILNEAGIINQPLTFEIYARFISPGEYQGGTYELNSKMAYSQIMTKLQRGVTEQETVRITFPEGYTIVQIAELLEENRVCSAEEFLERTDTGSFGFEFENEIPDDPLRFHKLEGYIFPETYEFYVDENIDSVIKKFLDVFNKRITQDLRDLMTQQGLTLDQTITLASIIQKETGNVDNMYLVSSVFRNRLNSDQFPKLQSDATVDYVEKQIKPNLSEDNQTMYDAYNTYVCDGLPVGPINNPGLDAIKAALAPAETNYYYFLSDQKGEYYFSSTLQEHNAYIASASNPHGTTIDHSSEE